MNLETKITIYKFTPQVFTLTQLNQNYAIEVNRKESYRNMERECSLREAKLAQHHKEAIKLQVFFQILQGFTNVILHCLLGNI